MVIETMILAFGGVLLAAILGFWGWLAVKVTDQGRKIVELEQRVNAQSMTCMERLEWLRTIEATMNRVAGDTLAIRVAMGEDPHI